MSRWFFKKKSRRERYIVRDDVVPLTGIEAGLTIDREYSEQSQPIPYQSFMKCREFQRTALTR